MLYEPHGALGALTHHVCIDAHRLHALDDSVGPDLRLELSLQRKVMRLGLVPKEGKKRGWDAWVGT
jgi:hypothetical protein